MQTRTRTLEEQGHARRHFSHYDQETTDEEDPIPDPPTTAFEGIPPIVPSLMSPSNIQLPADEPIIELSEHPLIDFSEPDYSASLDFSLPLLFFEEGGILVENGLLSPSDLRTPP